MDNRGKKSLIPEVVDENQQPQNKNLVKEERNKPLAMTYSKFSNVPFLNKMREIRLRGYRKVIREETGLMEDLIGHAKVKVRLMDVDVEIETERIERLNKLQETQRQAIASGRKEEMDILEHEVRRLENELKRADLQGRLKRLQTPPEEENKIAKLKRELTEKLLVKEILQDHDIKTLKLKLQKQLQTQEAIDEVFSQAIDEIIQGRDLNELSEEETKKLENLQDLYNKTLDDL